MSPRKIARRRYHQQRRGFMVVHKRWLSPDGVTTPACWLAWHERRTATTN